MELFVAHLESRTGMPYAQYVREGVLDPLGMSATELRGSPAYDVWSTLADLSRLAQELLAPRVIGASTLAMAVEVQFAGLRGILPDVGRFDPLDWGLGVERNFARPGHWAGSVVSPAAFGHFGGAGTFLVVDPSIERALVCLTDREFGPWALEAWPPFCDAVLAEAGAAAA
jgi:CubicO group peptidase (beta-lactamase class C family)